MNMNPDSEGWYHDVPAKSLDEWKDGQKIWGCQYDQTFCRPVVTKMKKKRKPKYNIHGFRLTGLMDGDRETSKDNKHVKRKTGKGAGEAMVTKEKYDSDIQVFVKTSISVTQCLKLKITTSVQDVKTLLEERLGVPSQDMQLYSRNLKLCDLLSLEDHGVTDQSNIEMSLSLGLRGGADRPDDLSENNSSAADKSNRQRSSPSRNAPQIEINADVSTSKQTSTSTIKAAVLAPPVTDAQLTPDVESNVTTGYSNDGAPDHNQRYLESTFIGKSKAFLPKEVQEKQKMQVENRVQEEENLDDDDEEEDYNSEYDVEEDMMAPVCEELDFVVEESGKGPPELPKSLNSDCVKLKKYPDHHKDYLSLEDTLEVCRGNKDHAYDNIIKGIGEQDWKKSADSIVLISVCKVVKQSKKKVYKKVCYGSGFVVKSSPANRIPAGHCAIMTACHTLLKHNKDDQLVECNDIKVTFFHDGLSHVQDDNKDDVVVTCTVTGIASDKQSLPQRKGESINKKHMDHAVLYTDIGKKIKELKKDIDKKDIDPQLKEIKHGHIEVLQNLLEIDYDRSTLIQLMEASCSDETSGNKLVLISVGHPHGAPKQVSFGICKSDTSSLFHTLKPRRTHVSINHTCTSCPGSSGSPISAIISYPGGYRNPDHGDSKVKHVYEQMNFLHISRESKGEGDVATGIAIALQSIGSSDKKQTETAVFVENVVAIKFFLETHRYCVSKKVWKKIKIFIDCLKKKYTQLKIKDWLKVNDNEIISKYIEDVMFNKLVKEPIKYRDMRVYRIISVEQIPEICQDMLQWQDQHIPQHAQLIQTLQMLTIAIMYDSDVFRASEKDILPVIRNWLNCPVQRIQEFVIRVLRSIVFRYFDWKSPDTREQSRDKLFNLRLVEPLYDILKQTLMIQSRLTNGKGLVNVHQEVELAIIVQLLGYIYYDDAHPDPAIISSEVIMKVVPHMCHILRTRDNQRISHACTALETIVSWKWLHRTHDILFRKDYIDILVNLCKNHENLLSWNLNVILNILLDHAEMSEDHRKELIDADILPVLKFLLENRTLVTVKGMNPQTFFPIQDETDTSDIRTRQKVQIMLMYLTYTSTKSGGINKIVDAGLLVNIVQMIPNSEFRPEFTYDCHPSTAITNMILHGSKNVAFLAIEAGCLQIEYFCHLICALIYDPVIDIDRLDILKVIEDMLKSAYTLNCYGDAFNCLYEATGMMGIRIYRPFPA